MTPPRFHKISLDAGRVTGLTILYPNGDKAVLSPAKNLGPRPAFKAAFQALAALGVKHSPFKLRAGCLAETRHLTLHYDDGGEAGDTFSVQISVVGTGDGAGGVSVTSYKTHQDRLSEEELDRVALVIEEAEHFLSSEEGRVQLDLFDDNDEPDLFPDVSPSADGGSGDPASRNGSAPVADLAVEDAS